MEPNFYEKLSSIHSLMNEVDEDDLLGGNVSDDEIIIDPNMNIDDENLPYNSDDDELDEQTCENETQEIFGSQETVVSKDNLEWHTKNILRPNERANMFREKSNLPQETKNTTTVLDAFHLFISENIVNKVVDCTNDFIDNIQDNFSRSQDCKRTTSTEIKALFGLLYMLGALRLHNTNIKQIWSDKPTGVEIFRLVMSYARFQFLLRCLRFDIKSRRDKNDKLTSIREIYEEFNLNLIKNWICGTFVTIDEKLEKFFGNCPFRMHIRSKPAKYGIKIFSIVDCASFYTSKIEIYCGTIIGKEKDFNNSFNVVKRMTSHLIGAGRNVTMDNWFTSYELLKYLLENKTTMVGTLRKNRKEVPSVMKQSTDREINSNIFLYRSDCMMVSKFIKQKKCVLLLSSYIKDNKMAESGKPGLTEVNHFYNMTKNAVDVTDQLTANYTVARKSRRWPLTVFFSFLNITAINAMAVLMANKERVDTSQLHFKNRFSFLYKLASDLIEPHLIDRSKLQNLPRGQKRRISEVLAEENQNIRPLLTPVKFPNPLRCYQCPSNVRSVYGCSCCKKPICNQHKLNICLQCLGEQITSNK